MTLEEFSENVLRPAMVELAAEIQAIASIGSREDLSGVIEQISELERIDIGKLPHAERNELLFSDGGTTF